MNNKKPVYPFVLVTGVWKTPQGQWHKRQVHFVLAEDEHQAQASVIGSMEEGRRVWVGPTKFGDLVTKCEKSIIRTFAKHGYWAGSVNAVAMVQKGVAVRVPMPEGEYGYGNVVSIGRNANNSPVAVCHIHTVEGKTGKRTPKPEQCNQNHLAGVVHVLY